MLSSNVALIIAAEAVLLLLALCMLLMLRNRSLRRLVNKLQSRLEQMVGDLRTARAKKPDPQTPESRTSYKELLDKQLELTRKHHESLEPGQDIVLDLDPDAPLPRRAAALRHAMLLAEQEAVQVNKESRPNWNSLRDRYAKIFSFYEDYRTPPSDDTGDDPVLNEEIDNLNEELTAAKKRINNLEKFKALYFELEGNLQDAKDTANKHYTELSAMASQVDDSEAFESTLDAYHSAYDSISKIIETGVEESTDGKRKDEDSSGEIRHLRAVAADQHKIITSLQKKLKDMSTEEQREEVVEELQGELTKQMRFVKESETCIQLMEDELSNANKEIEQLRSRINKIPQLKAEFRELRDQNDSLRDQVFALKTENRKINQKLQDASRQRPNPDSDANSAKLKKELAELQSQYADLEEKYLDLKLQQ